MAHAAQAGEGTSPRSAGIRRCASGRLLETHKHSVDDILGEALDGGAGRRCSTAASSAGCRMQLMLRFTLRV